MKRIGIGATVGAPGEEGEYALNLALQMVRNGIRPALLSVADRLTLHARPGSGLAAMLEEYAVNRAAFARNRGRQLPFPVLHALGDRLSFPASTTDKPGRPDIGLAIFEHLDIPAENLRRAAEWPMIITGSHWSARVLREQGLNNVVRCPPGVDLGLFHPAPRAGTYGEHFVVFSGGELGYHGGQDILIAAFRAFRQRHPEALLVCAWSPPALARLHELAASQHIHGLPEAPEGALRLSPWLARNGLPAESVIELGQVFPGRLPGILRESDLAVFPGRCAGAPPLAALQAMACGLPCAVAGNTGHLDLLGDHLYVLKAQESLADPAMQDWGECAVEELLETMERAYARRSEAAAKGRAAACFARGWSWGPQMVRMVTAIRGAAAGAAVPPADVEEDYAWGLGLHRAGRLKEAELVYDDILQRSPGHVGARGDRGNARRDHGDVEGAEADFRSILAARPDHRPALQSLASLLRRRGRLEEAAACLRRALVTADTPSLQWDLAFTLIMQGRYAEAWPHFEHRHTALGLRTADPAKPRWDGSPVTGGVLLVLDEQGLGDTLQFLRFLPRIPVGPAGRVIFAGKPATLSAVRRLLPAADVFAWDQPLPRSQSWVALMSLPARLGVSCPEDIPPPLAAPLPELERVAHWRPLVRGADDRPVVGLCWRGNPDFSGDAWRSPGLAPLRPLLEVEGLRFVSLQVGPGRGEIVDLGLTERLVDLGAAIDAAGPDVLDTLAALTSCDLIVTCSTSMAHMAGLADRPGWVLLADQPDWRWMVERSDTPWYPSLQLIRQRSPGDWHGVATEAAARLVAWRDQRRSG